VTRNGDEDDMGWRREIEELHQFFEDWFLGTESSMQRVEEVFAPDMTFVGPNGAETNRDETIRMIRDGRAHTTDLRITTTDHRLLHRADDVLVASYVEHHQLAETSNRRLSTVVFLADPDAPNGLLWLRVQETWIDNGVGPASSGS